MNSLQRTHGRAGRRRRLTKLSEKKMNLVCDAIAYALGMPFHNYRGDT